MDVAAGIAGVLWVELVALRVRLQAGEDPWMGSGVLFVLTFVGLLCLGALVGPILGEGAVGALGIGTLIPAGPRGIIAAATPKPGPSPEVPPVPYAEDGGIGARDRRGVIAYLKSYFS